MLESKIKVRSLLVLVGGLIWIVGQMCTPAPALATKYAGSFMENGGGARALAMGEVDVEQAVN